MVQADPPIRSVCALDTAGTAQDGSTMGRVGIGSATVDGPFFCSFPRYKKYILIAPVRSQTTCDACAISLSVSLTPCLRLVHLHNRVPIKRLRRLSEGLP